MASTTAATAGQFDDSNINWQPLPGIDDFVMSICSVDKAKTASISLPGLRPIQSFCFTAIWPKRIRL